MSQQQYPKVLIAISVLIFSALVAGVLSAQEFKPLELLQQPTSATVTDDGRLLLIGHAKENQLTVVDTATGKVIKSFACDAPISIMARGDKVLVANKTAGTISVYSISKDWEKIDELETGFKMLKWISAPGGKYFQDIVLATGGESQHVARIATVNIAKDKYQTIGDKKVGIGIATVSYDGTSYILQNDPWSGGGIKEMRDFKAAIAGRETESPKFTGYNFGFLYQVQPGPYWFGAPKLAKGVPPEEFGEADLGIIVVPDRLKNVCYAIDREQIRCLGLDLQLTKLGEQAVSFPKTYERMEKNIRKPNKAQRDDYGFNDRHHVAVTLGDKLYLYLFSEKQKSIYFAVLPAFDTSKIPAANVAGNPAALTPENELPDAKDTTSLPAKVQVGKAIQFNLPGGMGTTYELMTGPKSAKVDQGTLVWTPAKSEAGEQQFKIRVKNGSTVTFLRLQTTVVDLSDLPPTVASKGPTTNKPVTNSKGGNPARSATTTEPNLDQIGIHPLGELTAGLSYSLDRSMVLLADGNKIQFLDRSGLTVTREQVFESRYKQIAERAEYYVALAAKNLDLIDKKTLRVIKSIEIDYSQLNSMAIHPTQKQTYVAFVKTAEKDYIKSKPVLVVNEATGAITELPNVYGLWLHVTPKGDKLLTGLQQIYEDKTTLSLREEFAHVDRVFAYDITGAQPKLLGVNEQPGANGRKLRMSLDGRHVAYVAGGGAGGNGYSIAALATDDVSRESSRYQIDAYPTDIAFHPTLNLVACCNENTIWIFDRRTGEELSDRLEPGHKFQKIEQLFFTSGGLRLLVAHQGKQGKVLQAIPLKLSAAEQSQVGASAAAKNPSTATIGDANKGMRIWTDKTGKFKIEAELVKIENGQAVLRKPNGDMINVNIDILSTADQSLLKRGM
jgi:DNA-binding beta-propeller fold protein YncE